MGKRIDWEVSALGFGAMRLPTKEIVDEGDKKKRVIDEEKAIEMIRYAIDNGVNYVDTAWMYHDGTSEVLVGKALRDGYREKVHLVTKLPVGGEYMTKLEDFDRILTTQLERLQTDHLDIYLLHGLGKKSFAKVKEWNLMKKMEEAREKGLIKYIGFSFHDSYEVFKEIIDYYDWDACQIQHNYLDIDFQAGTKGLQYAANKGIAVIIMEPLRGGKLFIHPKYLGTKPEIQKALENTDIKRSMPDWALQFLWNQSEVSVVLSGMSAMQQVKENVESAENSRIGILSSDELHVIDGLRDAFNKYIVIPCTSCQYCMPCPEGVNIPMNLRLVNELVWWGELGRNNISVYYNMMAKNAEQMKESGKEDNGAASMCIKCGECLEKCPQSIEIPDELEKAVEIYENGKITSDFY